MVQDREDLRPSRLWKRMPEPMRRMASAAMWTDKESAEQQAEAVAAIAKQMKFRPKSVQALAPDRKARYLASIAAVPETLAARLLVSYHLAHQRPMMTEFLDALGIAHDNGLITEEHLQAPDPAKLAEAVRRLRDTHAPDAVRLYLSTLAGQDPETWGGLEPLIDRD